MASEMYSCMAEADTANPSDSYKRAVLQPPPSNFIVEFLVPTKSNGSYHHGMHISPSLAEGATITTHRSIMEYDIWRRWDDCLWFQDTLEKEYASAARERKTRLQQGKGVKTFDGFYKQDMASSWESLPPGPDPKSVAKDIHGYLPRLSRKGTLFRPSQATIEWRQKEFRALVEALFSDDMPSLIKEIRASTIVSDFFGLWRRDYEHMDISPKTMRSSVSSSVFSSYFSESSSSLSIRSIRTGSSVSTGSRSTIRTTASRSLPNSPAKRGPRSSAGSTERPQSIHSDITEVTRYPQSKRSSVSSIDTISDAPTKRRRPVSSSSDSSSSSHSDGSSDYSLGPSSAPVIVEDSELAFGHDPQSSVRPHSILEVLPEERDMLAKSQSPSPVPSRRTRASPLERRANRCWSIMESPSKGSDDKAHDRNVRESNSSLEESASELLAGLNLSLPHPIKDNKYRESLASISTFMTTDSADAVRRSPTSSSRHLSVMSCGSTTLSLSDFDIYSECGDDTDSIMHRRSILESSSLLDSFPRPVSYLPPAYRTYEGTGQPTTPVAHRTELAEDLPTTPITPVTNFSGLATLEVPPSPTSTISTAYTFSTITSTVSAGTISIKAAHPSGIILLRVSRDMTLVELRQRIYNKFVGQEGIPLAHDFLIAYTDAAQQSPVSDRHHLSDDAGLRFVTDELDWEYLVLTTNSKVTLRIMDHK